MSGDRQLLIKNLFQEALNLEPGERRHFVRERCGHDLELLREVESLLDFHESESGILDEPPDFAALDLPSPPQRTKYKPGHDLIGTEIGNHRLREFLGQGGMGQVYLAEQQRPVRRRVALKIVHSAAAAADVLARFESERQVLALMDHPGIARIFDAGTTEDGRPYFTMEYVTGVPITEYCDQHRLSIRERLQLFLHVCEGVQHAHQKGILHRDLKPSNILVSRRDGEAVPKIIDFGVAKALSGGLTATTPETAHGYLIGTPDYMSPEQASTGGQDVDTRSDIYSLGALLYEILCGVLPVDLQALRPAHYAQIQERICQEEPPPPSLRADTLANDEIARQRGVRPRGLRRQLQQDLDWVTMKALEKDRTRRYSTVAEMSADLGRYLQGEPVLAGPPSVRYRLQKFVRKNRIPLAAATAVVVALVAGLVASLNFAYRAESALEAAAASANQAHRSAMEARKITEYLESVLLTASPHRNSSPSLTIRDALARAEAGLDSILTAGPEINAAVRLTIARTHSALGLFEQAEHHARQGVMLLRDLPEPAPRALAKGLMTLALAHSDQAEFTTALPLFREALAIYRDQLGEESPEVSRILTDLVNINSEIGGFAETAASYRELIAWQERTEGKESLVMARTLMFFGHLLASNARYEEGEEHLERSLVIYRSHLGERNLNTAMARFYLGSLQRKRGDPTAAVRFLEQARDSLVVSLDPDHRLLLMVQRDLAITWSGLGRHAEAESLFTATLHRQRQGSGDTRRAVGLTLLYQGDHHLARDQREQSLACYEEAYGIAQDLFPDSDHFLKATVLQRLAELDLSAGDLRTARARLEASLEQHRLLLRQGHPHTLDVLATLTRLLVQLGDQQAATPLAVEYFTAASREYGADHAEARAAARLNLQLCEQSGATETAAHWRAWLDGVEDSPPVLLPPP